MKKVKLIILLNLLFHISYSQFFPIEISTPNTLNQARILQLEDGNYLVNNYVNDYKNSNIYSKIILFNQEGLILREKTFDYIIYQIISISVDSLLIVCNRNYESIGSYLISNILDVNLNVINSDSIKSVDASILKMGLIKNKNHVNYYVSYRYDTLQSSFQTFIGAINLKGNFIHTNNLIPYNNLGPYKILKDSNNYLYLFYVLGNVLKIDTSYQIVKELHLKQQDLIFDYDAFWIDEKKMVVGGTSIYNDLIVIENNENFIITNEKVFSNNSNFKAGFFSNLIKYDSCFYFIGNKNLDLNYGPFIPTPSSIFIAKMSYDFEVIWQKELGGDAAYTVFSAAPTKEEGCIIVTSRYSAEDNDENNDLYILKVSPDGYLDEIKIQMNGITAAYPNPGFDQLNIKIPNNYHNAKLNLYSMAGAKILSMQPETSQFTINTTELPTGIYIWEVQTSTGNFERGKWIKQ